MDEKSMWILLCQTYGLCLMVCWNLCQAHLQEGGLTQIMVEHVILKGLRLLLWGIWKRFTCPHIYMAMALGLCVKWPLHYTLRSLDPWHTNYVIGREAMDGPSSLPLEPKGLRDQRKFEWMEILHGTMWVLFHGLLDIALGSLKKGGFGTTLGAVASN